MGIFDFFKKRKVSIALAVAALSTILAVTEAVSIRNKNKQIRGQDSRIVALTKVAKANPDLKETDVNAISTEELDSLTELLDYNKISKNINKCFKALEKIKDLLNAENGGVYLPDKETLKRKIDNREISSRIIFSLVKDFNECYTPIAIAVMKIEKNKELSETKAVRTITYYFNILKGFRDDLNKLLY